MAARLTVTETRENLAEVIGKVQFGGERITILKHGKPVAAIVTAEDLAVLDALEDRALAGMVAEIHADPAHDPDDTIGHDDLWASLLPGDDKTR